MSDQGEHYENSWILYHILNRFIGNEETVSVRRRVKVIRDQMGGYSNTQQRCQRREPFLTGSRAEGFDFMWTDLDLMFIVKYVVVLCPEDDISYQLSTNKTILMMREANARPGYVNLELIHLGPTDNNIFQHSIVTVDDVPFISSELYSRAHCDIFSNFSKYKTDVHGPAANMMYTSGNGSIEGDNVHAFPCYNWPSEANEWVSRPRFYVWPDKALRDQIVQEGCQLVPVGDKTSPDPFLQWRISFVTAERKLIHSFSHIQFLVYGLFKIFLKQISGILNKMLGEKDILSSYVIKTVMFYAIERTVGSFWQEKHIFFCFMFCLKILINWVKAGHCPNYFIVRNNMFLGKVHGENKQRLLCFLTDLYGMNWKCLSVGTLIQPSITDCINGVKNGEWEYVLPSPTYLETENDLEIFLSEPPICNLPSSLKLLSESKSDLEEFVTYFSTVTALSDAGMKTFGEHIHARGNKEKYKSLRKCKNLIMLLAKVCSSPGLLSLATYFYQTGNYVKTLELCGYIISSPKPYLRGMSRFEEQMYIKHYCGRGHNLLHKRQAFASPIKLPKGAEQFCPSQLLPEITKCIVHVVIPPLPYAVFLLFLCYHELGDARRRDTAFTHLRAVKYDEGQGAGKNWIVHNLLGICYEMIGDTKRALMEYRDSLGARTLDHWENPAEHRKERLQHSQTRKSNNN